MRPLASVGVAVLLLTACIDNPFDPDISESLAPPPQLSLHHIRNGGTAELRPIDGTDEVFPRDVNRHGHVVGTSVGAAGPRSVLWRPASQFTTGRERAVLRDLAPLEHPVSIDDEGLIAGRLGERAAVWIRGDITDIGTLPGDDRSVVTAGSSTGGWVVGNSWPSSEEFDEAARGFRWAGGRMQELPPLPGDESSRAFWVNRYGVVAGVSIAPGVGRGMVVVWTDGVPRATGYEFTTYPPLGISDRGELLLSSVDGDDVFTWRRGIETRLPHPTPDNPGARFWGVKINAAGEVFARVEVDEPLIEQRFGQYSGRDFVFISPSPILDCPFFDGSFAVCLSPMRDHPFTVLTDGRVLKSGAVDDLTATEQTTSTVTLRWTQVGDVRGDPARYRVRYSEAPIHVDAWSDETRGCDVRGTTIGAEASCTIQGLEQGVAYDFQLMSYRLENGVWKGAKYSTVGIAQPGAGGGGGAP